MNIAMLISRYPPVLGGSEIQCQRLAHALKRKGHRVTILTEPVINVPDSADDNGIEVVRLGRVGGPRLLAAFFYMIYTLRYLRTQPSFDILHAHLIATPAITALWHGRRAHIPLIVK